MTLRSIALFVAAAVFEIGGAWLVWQAVREGRAWWLAALGVFALGLYGFAASFRSSRASSASCGRPLAPPVSSGARGATDAGTVPPKARPDGSAGR